MPLDREKFTNLHEKVINKIHRYGAYMPTTKIIGEESHKKYIADSKAAKKSLRKNQKQLEAAFNKILCADESRLPILMERYHSILVNILDKVADESRTHSPGPRESYKYSTLAELSDCFTPEYESDSDSSYDSDTSADSTATMPTRPPVCFKWGAGDDLKEGYADKVAADEAHELKMEKMAQAAASAQWWSP